MTMTISTATAIANPNIAFIKYWGNRDPVLRIPSNGSISMNLEGLQTRTQVTFDPQLKQDTLSIGNLNKQGQALERVSAQLERVRQMANMAHFAHVESENNFPTGTGIASSASAFSALTLAACHAAGLDLDERQLSRLARLASGSACRSVPGGFVEWHAGEDDLSSYAISITPADHWNLADCVAVVSLDHKHTSSIDGHTTAGSSPLQAARTAGAAARLDLCRNAILSRDFDALAEVAEMDSNLMHAVMMTSTPRLLYWQPETLAIMQAVVTWRRAGVPACYTIDAGPNVHVICAADQAAHVSESLGDIPGVKQVLVTGPGGAARLTN